MTVAELDSAIRSFNNLNSDSLKAGQEIIIPRIETQPVIEKPRLVARESDLRAVYLTGIMAGSDNVIRLVRHVVQRCQARIGLQIGIKAVLFGALRSRLIR